ncbi:DUF6896 domain-containing protein [Chryseobacterium culicis]|uniref:DUF6896 domain-containing protein n=1 Tax=Chryseobacterium culicis TaxID=680127 RepID=A0A1H6IAD1_CHRCI|nr:hypothetical protein [Chryseobacterium culicis]SEH45582.1 hypothetical protein SAMN05421593_4347 [Chryseobacterium culicis]
MDYSNKDINTKKLLEEYLVFIVNFESVLKKEYDIPKNINIWSYLVERKYKKGTVATYNYICHGSGFTVEKNGIICEYDKAPLNEYDIKFSFWKFKNFIETNHMQIIIDDSILKKDLSDLITANIVSWLIIDGINWNIYQTNFTVLQSL